MSNLINHVDTYVITGHQGILVIGDPMLGSQKRVGRVDDTWSSLLAKLEQALLIAKDRNLLPIIFGDLLHESRDIGQLLPIIDLLRNTKCLLLPRNNKWQERDESHIAAILKAANICHVAGSSAKKYQLPITTTSGDLKVMEIEAHACWGGIERLEPGARAFLRIPSMNICVSQSSKLPHMDSCEGQTQVVPGRLLRLVPTEERMAIQVFSITPSGIEPIDLSITPVVFSVAAGSASDLQQDLNKQSVFVEKLRAAAGEALEEEGKSSLLALVDELCLEIKADPWMQKTLLELATEAGTRQGA